MSKRAGLAKWRVHRVEQFPLRVGPIVRPERPSLHRKEAAMLPGGIIALVLLVVLIVVLL